MDISFSASTPVDRLKRIWQLCCEAATVLYGSTPPSPAYAERTARLLFLTGAQESGFLWERQRAPQYAGSVGGFGKWQVEPGSINDSILFLRHRPDVLARATQWLFNDPHAPSNWSDIIPMETLLWALRMDDNDKIGLLFCRLHYMRLASPIPESEEDQAVYYKTFYNTKYGAATIPGTLDSYRRYAAMLAKTGTVPSEVSKANGDGTVPAFAQPKP